MHVKFGVFLLLPGAFVVWDIVRTNWDAMESAFGEMDLLGVMLITIYNNFDSSGALEDVRVFLESKPAMKGTPTFIESMETIQFNIQWNANFLNETVSLLTQLVS